MVFKCCFMEKSESFHSLFWSNACIRFANNGLSDYWSAESLETWINLEWAKKYTGLEHHEIIKKVWGKV